MYNQVLHQDENNKKLYARCIVMVCGNILLLQSPFKHEGNFANLGQNVKSLLWVSIEWYDLLYSCTFIDKRKRIATKMYLQNKSNGVECKTSSWIN